MCVSVIERKIVCVWVYECALGRYINEMLVSVHSFTSC